MNALDALLEGLFDYAGMFPPAALSLEEAVRESARFPDALERPDMLGADLVLRPDGLARLRTEDLAAAGFSPRRGCKICLVGVPLADAEAQARNLTTWNQERALAKVPQSVVSLEVHADLARPAHEVAASLMPLRFLLAETDVRIYLEPAWDDATWQERFDDAFACIDATNEDGELRPVGLKVRCGGPNALSPATLARIIAAVNERELAWKATQGLHHPLVEERHGNQVGFVGLVTALRLQRALGESFGADESAACIAEQDPDAFTFDDGLRWRDHVVAGTALGRTLRTRFQIGSCSLREPDEDLKRLFAPAVPAA